MSRELLTFLRHLLGKEDLVQIEIKSVSEPYVKNKYGRLDLEYVSGGKSQKKTLTAVGETKNVIQKLKEAKPNEVWDIKLEKDGEYWNWVEAVKNAAADTATPQRYSANTKSHYETPEERAQRQVYIIKQSSLTNAINLRGPGTSLAEILATAQAMVDWVVGNNAQTEKPAAKAGRRKIDDNLEDDGDVFFGEKLNEDCD